jgi:homocitrate synthase NifV
MHTIAKILLDFGITRFVWQIRSGLQCQATVQNVLSEFALAVGNRADLGFHAHNDLGMAVANTVQAAKCGCKYADVTVGGIGASAQETAIWRTSSRKVRTFRLGKTKIRRFSTSKRYI